MSVAVAQAKSEQSDVYEREDLLNGCQAVAQGVRLADVDVIAAYPIRPYTEVMDMLSKIIADGQLDAEYIIADSEHSQFEIVKHAASVGARAFAGSSGTGWMYGFEALVVTATDRLPPVFIVGNRALDDPGAFGVEHNDAMAVRDMGWLLLWVATPQEALEHILLGYRIAEDKRVRMPLALAMDGAFLTHSQHIVKIPTKESVKKFLPTYDLGEGRLHPDNPISIAPQVNEDWVMEIRRQNWEAAKRAYGVIEEAYKDFKRVFGRDLHNPWFEEYMTDDNPDVILMGMGTLSMPVKVTIRKLRAEGKKVGFIRLKWFRPFPYEQLAKALGKAKAVGVIDRDYSFGSPFGSGVVANEVRSAMYNSEKRPPLIGFICGLGGREVTIENVTEMVQLCEHAAKTGKTDK